MYDFEFVRPGTIAAAAEALASEDALPMGGGQTLIPTMKNRLASASAIVSLTGIPEMQGISRDEGGRLSIGAATSHADVAAGAAEAYPALASLANNIGDPAVRNRGTIGGSLANNDPSACYPAAVLASDASVETNRRAVAAGDFFNGLFETSLEDGEFIVAVHFPVPDLASYAKFEQPASRFALVGVFVALYGSQARVAVTGASDDGVFRWSEAEERLSGAFAPEVISDLAPPDCSMMSDIHGSEAYRADLVKVMTKRAVEFA